MTSRPEKLQHNLWNDHEILSSLIHQVPIGIIIIDLYGFIHLWNKEAERIFGWTEAEVKGKLYHLIMKLGESKYRRAFRKIAQARKGVTFSETKRKRKDGSDVTVCINAIPLIEEDDRVIGITFLIEDLTDQKNSEKILKNTMNELENLKFSLDESSLLTITDPRGMITYVNDRFCELFQYSREELIGYDHRVINSKYHPKEFFKNMWRTLGNGKIFRGEIRNRAKDGTIVWVDGTIVPFINEKGRPYQYMSICTDITDKKRAEEELVFLAYHDELTGLSNRRKMSDLVAEEINQNQPFALLSLDLNRFRHINESYGFSVGDGVISEFANRLVETIPNVDHIARKDSDKFIILLKGMDDDEVHRICGLISKNLQKPFEINNNRIHTTSSIGVCFYPKDGSNFEELLNNAVYAMHEAKIERKSYIRFFDKQLEQEKKRRIELEKCLREALENQELSLHYQPRVDTNTRKITGMEALLRWNSQKLGMVSPNEFIPIAEETGFIVPIGKWVMGNAMSQTKKWHQLGFSDLKVSLNLSPIQLMEPDIDEQIIKTIRKINYPPNLLELEITENAALENNKVLFQKLNRLKEFGVQISIDDFGTGYSSLSYLREFPINRLKIDRSFLEDIAKSGDSPIVRTILAMAKSLGYHVTAEGIEIEEQILYLQNHGCDELQGFYFGKPVAANEFLHYLYEAI
ncbi:EAL domain-containing protein [Robertmurraya andreesenii]|uniref:Diguanylate cyclase (GGDEF)-like protein/PAS domain S-box-containing protein n=1 Tax=Anoxybacillus andreesenii TaxID=1325932 RepID=A0ABT9V3F6_9BACL|nr:EAL domain-containing protein [Robertmurraya andreesenii]MDQ0155486.1 diguanylate cyclase (GGDEF)-like protein/PAS domain S-box-containing protein [Robertmurraya andreesenii]